MNYELQISPKYSENSTKFIKFVNKVDKSIVWYNIDFKVNKGPAQYCLEMTAPIRKRVSVDIKIFNASNSMVDYSVKIEGQYLHGPSKVSVGASSDSNYELVFHPCR